MFKSRPERLCRTEAPPGAAEDRAPCSTGPTAYLLRTRHHFLQQNKIRIRIELYISFRTQLRKDHGVQRLNLNSRRNESTPRGNFNHDPLIKRERALGRAHTFAYHKIGH